MSRKGKQIRNAILRELGNVAFHLASHYHVFVTDDLQRIATTRSVAIPFHCHKVMTSKRYIRTEPSMAGEQHKHELIFKGRKLMSGVPL